jgi:hypothetical protein
MLPIKLRLEPAQDMTHTTVRLSFQLARPLKAWQLTDLAQLLRAWTLRRTRVVLSAGAPAEWFEDWSPELADADVEVAWPKRGGRRDR